MEHAHLSCHELKSFHGKFTWYFYMEQKMIYKHRYEAVALESIERLLIMLLTFFIIVTLLCI